MKQSRSSLKTLGFVLVILVTFLAGWNLGYKGYQLSFSTRGIKVINREPPSDLERTLDLTLFWKTLSVLEDRYYDFSSVDADVLLYGAIKGMVDSLGDPYTAFFTPAENEEFKSSLAGVYEGIGAQLGFSDHQLVIIAPLKGSPAEKAGIKGGDAILEVDGESTQGWPLGKAVSRIRGEKGAVVELTIERESEESEQPEIFKVKIERGTIRIQSLVLGWKEGNIALVTVYRFGENIRGEWGRIVEEIIDKKASGLIIDVRNNPGGYLEGAVYLASEFFSNGNIVLKRNADQKVEKITLDHKGRLTRIPVVVLINKWSASASEIVAGAIQVRERGILIGQRSFGKGTVQEALDLLGGAGLHVTISDWLLPNGESVSGVGLVPDIEVVLTDDDMLEGGDPQLQRALEELK